MHHLETQKNPGQMTYSVPPLIIDDFSDKQMQLVAWSLLVLRLDNGCSMVFLELPPAEGKWEIDNRHALPASSLDEYGHCWCTLLPLEFILLYRDALISRP